MIIGNIDFPFKSINTNSTSKNLKKNESKNIENVINSDFSILEDENLFSTHNHF